MRFISLIKKIFRFNKNTNNTFTVYELNDCLKNLTSPHLLQDCSLKNLKQVQNLASEEKISKIDALIKVIHRSVESFKPQKNGDKRTAARLKYEILKMIAYEGATESQIMWDLGFDVYVRTSESKFSYKDRRKPRFQVVAGNEYYSTSHRSYKRLKKESLKMLKWRLKEGEKRV